MNHPIVIYRSVNRDGATFALKPTTREYLQDRLGDAAHFRSRIFIAHETRADYDAVHVSVAPQVVQLLTGMSADRLKQFGELVFRDPVTEAEIPQSAA